MINWSHIYEGWKNHLVPSKELKGLISQTAQERMEICNGCEMNSRNIKGHKDKRITDRCTVCGCPLLVLTKCLSCNCGLEFPKWEAVITEHQEEEFTSVPAEDIPNLVVYEAPKDSTYNLYTGGIDPYKKEQDKNDTG